MILIKLTIILVRFIFQNFILIQFIQNIENFHTINKQKILTLSTTEKYIMLSPRQSLPANIQQIQQSLLQNQTFIQQLRTKLSQFSSLQVQSKIGIEEQKRQSQTCISSSLKYIKKGDLDLIISQISQILDELITQKLEYQLNEIIEENNNVLLQIRQNLLFQQKQNMIMMQPNNRQILQQDKGEMSFSDVHKLIAEQKKKFQNCGDGVNDADLQKSISSLVDFKFESIEQKVLNVDKRLKTMQDKYETNLKSIWNVLSMTQGAVFEFINKERQKQKSQLKKQAIIQQKKQQTIQKKSTFFKLW